VIPAIVVIVGAVGYVSYLSWSTDDIVLAIEALHGLEARLNILIDIMDHVSIYRRYLENPANANIPGIADDFVREVYYLNREVTSLINELEDYIHKAIKKKNVNLIINILTAFKRCYCKTR